MLFVQFSGALDTMAAQTLAAYTALSGKTTARSSQGLSGSLQQVRAPDRGGLQRLGRYRDSRPQGQAHVAQARAIAGQNTPVLTDPMGRLINNELLNATTNTGFIVTTSSVKAASIEAPAPAAIDALFEQGWCPRLRCRETAAKVAAVDGFTGRIPTPGSNVPTPARSAPGSTRATRSACSAHSRTDCGRQVIRPAAGGYPRSPTGPARR